MSPKLSKKPCAVSRCSELVEAGETYCEEHRDVKKKRDKDYNKYDRDERSRKFYSSIGWQKLREMKKNDNPLCEKCKEEGRTKQADVVDHIIPIRVDWSKRLKYGNLQSLCRKHHREKTEKDKQKYECL